MANVFTVTEQLPEAALFGGAAISLEEVQPVVALIGSEVGSLAITEQPPLVALSSVTAGFALEEVLPVVALRNNAGTFDLTEPPPEQRFISSYATFALREALPTVALETNWATRADLAVTETAPTVSLSGYRTTDLAVTEALPAVALTGRVDNVFTLTEALPTVALNGVVGTLDPGAFAVTEQLPVLAFISFTSSSAAEDVVVPTDEILPLTEYTAWSVNVANGAHAGFTNYQFNSFFAFEGKQYGLSDSGVFELVGDDDDGELINAKAVWGVSDLGTHYPKRFYRAFLTARDRGGYVSLAVIMDEVERQEFSCDHSGKAGVHTKPVRLRRDMIGTNVAVELANVAGEDIDVLGPEIEHQVLKRRA